MAEIVLQGISKGFADGKTALEQTDLRIGDGEFFVIVGPSGCGKTTLLNIIVGLEEPSTGEVLVDGEAVTGRDPKDRNMAMVFQSYALYPHMTVRENMAFPLRLARLTRGEIDRRVGWAAELLELDGLLDSRPAVLSGGERQRVAMGRAIVRQPAAFLLDEPLSNLDARLRVQMRTELARLQRRLGTTTVYVTHDQTEAMTLGDRVAVLRRGRVQQVGSPRDLYEHPANLFVAAFVGSPAMNFLPARIRADRLVLPMLDMPLPERFRSLAGGDQRVLIAGVRPEHFYQAGVGPQDTAAGFTAALEMVEWQGADQYVHFDVDLPAESAGQLEEVLEAWEIANATRIEATPVRLIARMESSRQFGEDELVQFGVDVDRLHLFDRFTGERIVGSNELDQAI